ncbi:MAG: hypothetical protein M3343_04855 [Actinomycetota bacterium]|nr:hypothetical protein [Actinomycetota bacterium]
MSSPPSLPEDAHLREVAEQLEATGWAAEILDTDWRLVWLSSGLLELIGERDPAKLGYGEHLFEHFRRETWTKLMTPESLLNLIEVELPMVLNDMPGGKEELKRIAGPDLDDLIDSIEERTTPPIWASQIQFVHGDLPPVPVNFHGHSPLLRRGPAHRAAVSLRCSASTPTRSSTARSRSRPARAIRGDVTRAPFP